MLTEKRRERIGKEGKKKSAQYAYNTRAVALQAELVARGLAV